MHLLSRSALLLIVAATPVLADGAADGRREAEAARLLHEREAGWIGEIAGYNRRNAICDRNAALAASVDDNVWHALFVRTLGWRWDAAAARWVPSPIETAEVRLQYAGPVLAGTVTLEGREVSYCHAEAPNHAFTSWRQGDAAGAGWSGNSLALPALPSGFSAPATDAVASAAPPTPMAERAARIARATTLFRDEAVRIAAASAGRDAPAGCRDAISLPSAIRHKDWNEYFRHDVAHDTWVAASPAEAEVALNLSTPRDGRAAIGRDCLPFRPVTLQTRAMWQAEGATILVFHKALRRSTREP